MGCNNVVPRYRKIARGPSRSVDFEASPLKLLCSYTAEDSCEQTSYLMKNRQQRLLNLKYIHVHLLSI